MTWGPFREGLDDGERKARLRCLRTLVHVIAGPAADATKDALRAAEIWPSTENLQAASAAIDRLPSLDRRRVLATYGRI